MTRQEGRTGPHGDAAVLSTEGRNEVYLALSGCGVTVSAGQ